MYRKNIVAYTMKIMGKFFLFLALGVAISTAGSLEARADTVANPDIQACINKGTCKGEPGDCTAGDKVCSWACNDTLPICLFRSLNGWATCPVVTALTFGLNFPTYMCVVGQAWDSMHPPDCSSDKCSCRCTTIKPRPRVGPRRDI
jgi:hypothetical protein